MLQQHSLSISLNELSIAQAEFDAYIEAQAQEIAPELEVQFIDLDGFYNYEAQAAGKTIATITHDCDDFVTQPWIVMVGEVEVHRAETWAKCAHYIQWHYLRGTLPKLRTASPEELLDKPFCDLNHNLTKRSRNTSKAVRTKYGFLATFGDLWLRQGRRQRAEAPMSSNGTKTTSGSCSMW